MRFSLGLLGLVFLGLVTFFFMRSSQPVMDTPAEVPAAPEGQAAPQPVTPSAQEAVPTERPAERPAGHPSANVEQELLAALQKDPQNAELLQQLGLYYAHEKKDPNQALAYFERSLKANAQNGSAFNDAVGAYLEFGQNERGIAFLRSLLDSRSPNEGTIRAALADLYASSGKLDEALPHVLAGLREQPDSSAQHALAGEIFIAKGDKRAIGHLRQAEEFLTTERQNWQRQGAPPEQGLLELQKIQSSLVTAYMQQGNRRAAREYIDALPESDHKQNLLKQMRDQRAATPPLQAPIPNQR